MAKQWKQSLTASEVQAEAEDALEKDISQLSPASNSVAANLDGGVSAVDWASKQPRYAVGLTNTNTNTDAVSVSGSGYIVSIEASAAAVNVRFRIDVDGSTIRDATIATNSGGIETASSGDSKAAVFQTLFYRFETGFSAGTGSFTGDTAINVGVSYVLD